MDSPATTCVCVVTAVVTLLGFRDHRLRNQLLFEPRAILAEKQWYRLFSSALLHADLAHVFFNLFTIYSFGTAIEFSFGAPVFLLIYVLSVLGGSLLSLYVHRHHDYAALGASGGGCGVVFSAIFLVPGTGVGMYFLPFSIPGPVYAVLYLAGTLLAMRRNKDNIGHDAHFGGAVVGLVLALILAPQNCLDSPILFASAVLVSAAGILAVFRDPLGLVRKLSFFGEPEYKPSIRYQAYDERRQRNAQAAEIDRILDKVSRKGVNSLSAREKATLNAASGRIRTE